MATEEDILRTQLEVAGLGDWQNSMRQMAGALGLVKSGLEETAQKQLALGVAAGAASLGIASFLGRAARAAGDEAQAYDNAANSFRSHNQQFTSSAIADFANQLEDLTGVEDAQIGKTVGLLGTFGLTQAQVKTLTPALLDAARALDAQGVSAEGLAVQLGKAIQGGNVAGLRRIGVFVDEGRFAMDRFGAVVEAVARQGEGAAARFRRSLPGEIANLKNQLGNLQEAIGTPLIGPVSAVAGFIGDMARDLSRMPGFGGALAAALGVGVVAGAVAAVRQAILLRNALVEGAGAAVTIAGALRGSAGGAGRGALSEEAQIIRLFQAQGIAPIGGGAPAAAGLGLLGRLKAGIGPGLAFGAAGLGLSALSSGLGGQDTAGGRAAGIGGDVFGGAGAGAFVGSAFGPLGMLVGALVGGAGAGIYDVVTQQHAGKGGAPKSAADTRQDEIVRLLKEQNSILAGLKGSTGDYDQIGGHGRLFAGAEMIKIIRDSVR